MRPTFPRQPLLISLVALSCLAGPMAMAADVEAGSAPSAKMVLATNPLVNDDQRRIEAMALNIVETPAVRAAQERARHILLADPVSNTLDGRLNLDRALSQWTLALAMRVANSDPSRPAIIWTVNNGVRQWFNHIYPGALVAVDNPDNINREIPVDGVSTYEITGQLRRPSSQLTFELLADMDEWFGLGQTLKAITRQQIVTKKDGSFVLTVSPDKTDKPNHMQSRKGAAWLVVRDSLPDWKILPTSLTVRRVSGPPAGPEMTEARATEIVAANLENWIKYWSAFKDTFLGNPDPNTLVGPIARIGGWGYQAGGRFDLTSDEALVITATHGDAAYVGLQITDPWTLSPDPVYRTASLNNTQVKPNADGSVTYVVSLRDPGVYNWIDTVGLRQGWFHFRWQGVPATAKADQLIRSVQKVKLSDLPTLLASDVPRIDLAARSEQIAKRVSDYAVRTQR